MTPHLYYYYVTELAFYWSLMFSQFTDIKRKVRGTTSALSLMVYITVDTSQLPVPVKHLIIFLVFLIWQWKRMCESVCESVCVCDCVWCKTFQAYALLQARRVWMITCVCFFFFLEGGGVKLVLLSLWMLCISSTKAPTVMWWSRPNSIRITEIPQNTSV